MADDQRARTPPVVSRGAAAAGLVGLALFIIYGSSGEPSGMVPRATALPGISLPDIAQNLLLYIPFGTLGVWVFRGSGARRPRLVVGIALLALVFSAAIELLQMLSASRIASPLDVIANVAGAGVGAMAAEAVERVAVKAADATHVTGVLTSPARYVLLAVFAAILVAAWYPFDLTLDVSTLSERTRAVRLDPWLWPGPVVMGTQAIRFFVLTAVLVWCLPGLARRAAPIGLLLVMATAVAIDLGQLAMGSQPTGVAVLLSQAAGACGGAGAVFVLTLARGTWYAAA